MISIISETIYGLLVMEVYFILQIPEIVSIKNNMVLQEQIFGDLERDLKMEM